MAILASPFVVSPSNKKVILSPSSLRQAKTNDCESKALVGTTFGIISSMSERTRERAREKRQTSPGQVLKLAVILHARKGKQAGGHRPSLSKLEGLSFHIPYAREIEISNNQVENAIRPFVVGRKGWLFCDTPKGATASAVVYTLVETAKANGLDPYRYLLRLLTYLPMYGENPSDEKLRGLLPWSGGMKAECTV